MRTLTTLLLLLAAVPLAAQRPPARLELAAGVSHWDINDINHPSSSVDRPVASLRAGVLFGRTAPLGFSLTATRAGQTETAPALRAYTAEVTQRLLVIAPTKLNLFVSAGAGAVHLETRGPYAPPIRCPPEQLCVMGGGVYHLEGWRPLLNASLGLDVPVTRGLVLQPTVGTARLLGDRVADEDRDRFVRFGLALAWRP